MVAAAIVDIDCNKEGHLMESPQMEDSPGSFPPLVSVGWNLVDTKQNIKDGRGKGREGWDFCWKVCPEAAWTPPTPQLQHCSLCQVSFSKEPLVHSGVQSFYYFMLPEKNICPWTCIHHTSLPNHITTKPILKIFEYIYSKYFLCI